MKLMGFEAGKQWPRKCEEKSDLDNMTPLRGRILEADDPMGDCCHDSASV